MIVQPARCGLIALAEVTSACVVLAILLGLGMNLSRMHSRLQRLHSLAAEHQQALNILAYSRAQGQPPEQPSLPLHISRLEEGLLLLRVSLSDGSFVETLLQETP